MTQPTPRARTILLTDAGTSVFSAAVAAYDGTPTGLPAPTFAGNPSITSDGTPQVGEDLTGVDAPALNLGDNRITRAWLDGTTVLSSQAVYRPQSAKTLVFRNQIVTVGGLVLASVGVEVTVAAAPVVDPTPAPTPTPGATPTLTIGGPLAFEAGAYPGSLVATIANVPASASPTLTPNDGRLVVAGNATDGWTVVVGLSASSAGEIQLAVAATGAIGASATVVVHPPAETGYAQGMGATAADGLVVEFPLDRDGVARQMFVDPINGNDDYNGFSPTPGFQGNGTGPFFQWGATGRGDAHPAYGPKKTYIAAEKALPELNVFAGDAGVGHHILLRQGTTHFDATQAEYGKGNRATFHYGKSIAFPFVLQSYDPQVPWNGKRHGRARGADMPIIKLSADKVFNFNNSSVNQTPAPLDQLGLISNFAFRGFAFHGPNARIEADLYGFKFGQTDTSNMLIENVDNGAAFAGIDNASGRGKNTRWNRNLIIRKCKFEGHNTTGAVNTGAIHSSNILDKYVEDCLFLHCGWPVQDQGRYLPPENGGPSILRHDIYFDGPQQDAATIRRCVSIDANATFLANRGNCHAYHNVVINAPIGLLTSGGVSNYSAEQRNGNYSDLHHNFILGGNYIRPSELTVTGIPAVGAVIAAGITDFSFVASGAAAGPNQIALGSTPAEVAAAIVAKLNAHADPYISRHTWFLFTPTRIRMTPKRSNAPYSYFKSYTSAISSNFSLPRSNAFGISNGVVEMKVRDNLMVNSGAYDAPGIVQGCLNFYLDEGRDNAQSYAKVYRNKALRWAQNQEAIVSAKNLTIDYHENTYSGVSPVTDDEFYASLGYASRDALQAAMSTSFDEPWAARILAKASTTFGHSFALPATAAPVITQAPAASTNAPKVGDTITFTPPTFTGGIVVSATTYVGAHGQLDTGVGQDTFVVTAEHVGSVISRMWLIAPAEGGPPTTSLCNIPAFVAEAPVVAPPAPAGFRYGRLVATESAGNGRNFVLAIAEIWFELADGSIIRPSWTGQRGDSDHFAQAALPELIDSNLDTSWRSPGMYEVSTVEGRVDFGSVRNVKKFVLTPQSSGGAPGKWQLYLSASPIVPGTNDGTLAIDLNEPETAWTTRVARTFPLS